MFAVPAPKMLLTEEELGDHKRKAFSLRILIKHPNSKNPDIKVPLAFLASILQGNMGWGRMHYDMKTREVFDSGMRCASVLENILIQVIVQGRDYNEILNEEFAKPTGRFLSIFM